MLQTFPSWANFIIMEIPADHPALAGHFPCNPIVPGVVLLDEVIHAFSAYIGRPFRITGFSAVKFTAPLPPQRLCTVTFTGKAAGRASFEVTAGEKKIVSGNLTYEDG